MVNQLQKISIQTLENLLRLIGSKWLGPWQREMAESLISNRELIIQAPRQVGKTYVVALLIVAYILCGGTVVLGMPTLKQTKSVIMYTVMKMVGRLRRKYLAFNALLRSEINNRGEQVYRNGGRLIVISMKQVTGGEAEITEEGYTSDLNVIDEGHRGKREILGVISPFLTQAKRQGWARSIILGVGGHKSSLIEEMKTEGYSHIHFDRYQIEALDPSYTAVFDSFLRELTPIQYRQHILCESVAEGMHKIFGPIQLAIPMPPEEAAKYREVYHFGIDVGRTSDLTMVTAVRHKAGYIDLMDTYSTRGDFYLADGGGQDEQVYAWIDAFKWKGERIAIEINGLGVGLWDVLKAEKLIGMSGVHLDEKMKRFMVDQLIIAVRDGRFRCVRQEDADHLEGLQFEIKENGKYVYEHSDLLSSLIMAYCSMQTVAAY